MGDATAARRAAEAVTLGFRNVRILDGGVAAWKEAAGDPGPAPSWAALFPQ